MFTGWIKNISLCLLSLLCLGWWGSCSENTSPEPDKAPLLYTSSQDSVYYGVPIKFWAVYNRPLTDTQNIRWELGRGTVVKRSLFPNDSVIKADTVYVIWDRLPELLRDSLTKKMVYRDTVRVSLSSMRSHPQPVRVDNLVPFLDSIKVQNGFAFAPRGDSIYIQVHNGEDFSLRTYTTDLLKNSSINYIWPDITNCKAGISDTLFNCGVANETIFDQNGELILQDGQGAKRVFNLRLRTYQETGTVWVGTSTGLLKVSLDGQLVFKTALNYTSNLLMTINSSHDILFLVEGVAVSTGSMQVRKYTTQGFARQPQVFNTFSAPTAMATWESMLWIAEEKKNLVIAESLKYSVQGYSIHDLKISGKPLAGIKGKVLGMVARPDLPGTVWSIQGGDTGAIVLSNPDTVFVNNDSTLIGPNRLDWDVEKRTLWVSNGREVVMYNSSGREVIRVRGFGSVSSLSASAGVCWVTDPGKGIIVILNESQVGERELNTLKTGEYLIKSEEPVASAVVRGAEPRCWVADNRIGRLTLYDRFGQEKVSYTGMIAPRILEANQSN